MMTKTLTGFAIGTIAIIAMTWLVGVYVGMLWRIFMAGWGLAYGS